MADFKARWSALLRAYQLMPEHAAVVAAGAFLGRGGTTPRVGGSRRRARCRPGPSLGM
jgi:hypothetical protein